MGWPPRCGDSIYVTGGNPFRIFRGATGSSFGYGIAVRIAPNLDGIRNRLSPQKRSLITSASGRMRTSANDPEQTSPKRCAVYNVVAIERLPLPKGKVAVRVHRA